MKVLLLGAAGRTGRELVSQALARGHRVTALVRHPHTAPEAHPGLTVVHGDVTDQRAVAGAVAGQEAVVCALGSASPRRRDPALVDGVRNVVDAMTASGVPRLVYLSFLGVPAGRHQLSLLGRTLVSRVVLRHVVADHAAKEALISASGLSWTLVRPPRLTDGLRTGAYRHGETITAVSVVPRISRADLAAFMLDLLESDGYVNKAAAVMC
ncbi:NAD(P)-dependent oxidoreductase [Ornithinimicrobium cavernae]|uniref:NAD(P)-dependent oxidoreductase n=1 Tax=Ornithinimicrobium cavernae TaxID=2666047 RepID=UPI000D68F0BB|nr:SDR family oxidoreductase [Ornithinimicrobium cavernae]